MKTTNLLKIFIILNEFLFIPAYVVKFTNLECNAVDPKFVEIPHCRLKVVGRNKVALNFHLKMLQLPLDNLTVWGQFFRKSNEYRPFLYNTSTDFCGFLKNGNKFLFWKILWDIVRPFSNANHTCPYNHDIIVDNLILEEGHMKLILFPAGEYLIRLYLLSFNKAKVNVNTYFAIREN